MACSARDSPWSADAAALHFYRLNCNGKPVFFVLSISDLFEMRLKGFPLGTHRDLLGFSTIEYCVSLSSLLEWAPLFEMNFFFIKKKKETREQASRGFGRSPVTTNQLSGKWQDVGPPSIECHHNRNGKRQRGRLKGGGPLRTTQVRFDWRISVQRSIGTPQKTRSIRAERRASCLISIRPSPVGADQRQSLRNAAAFILLLLLHFLRETFRWRPLSSAAGGIGVDRRWRSNPSIKTESALEKKKKKQEWETFLLPAHWVLIEKYNDEKESSSKNSRPSIHRIATLTLVISDSTRTSRS